MKNTLEKEGCLDEKEVVPMVPIANIYVNAVAGRKLVYREERKLVYREEQNILNLPLFNWNPC